MFLYIITHPDVVIDPAVPVPPEALIAAVLSDAQVLQARGATAEPAPGPDPYSPWRIANGFRISA
jgi:hypothetical protein